MDGAASPDRPLAGRLALVTGASRGIGAATAIALAAAGAHVVLVARSAKGLEQVEETIHEGGGSATIAPLDLTQGDAIARLASAISQRWQALDLLVLNAAMLPPLTPVAQIDPRQFNATLTLNLLAPQALIAAFDPLLRKSRDARVIGITSSVGANPRAYWGAYGASKAAFANLLLTYGQEVGKIAPIRVVLVDPGATRTRMRASAFPGEDPASVKPPEMVAERIVALAGQDIANGHFERIEDRV